jgi:hypothetical protein
MEGAAGDYLVTYQISFKLASARRARKIFGPVAVGATGIALCHSAKAKERMYGRPDGTDADG